MFMYMIVHCTDISTQKYFIEFNFVVLEMFLKVWSTFALLAYSDVSKFKAQNSIKLNLISLFLMFRLN